SARPGQGSGSGRRRLKGNAETRGQSLLGDRPWLPLPPWKSSANSTILGGRIATTGAKSGCCDLRSRPTAPTATGSASKTYRPAGRFPVLKSGSGPLLIIAPHPGRPSAGALALYAPACPPVRDLTEFGSPRKWE